MKPRLRWFVILGSAIALPVVVIGWWLVSPLFLDTAVDEDFPLAANAVIPPGRTRQNVELTMEAKRRRSERVEEPMPADGRPAALALGRFRDADASHKGRGEATLYALADGKLLLRLEDFEVTNGPQLHVLLSEHPKPGGRGDLERAGYLDLGRLKGNIGDQNYDVPAGSDPAAYHSVVIYCKPFRVLFSTASLRATGG